MWTLAFRLCSFQELFSSFHRLERNVLIGVPIDIPIIGVRNHDVLIALTKEHPILTNRENLAVPVGIEHDPLDILFLLSVVKVILENDSFGL